MEKGHPARDEGGDCLQKIITLSNDM